MPKNNQKFKAKIIKKGIVVNHLRLLTMLAYSKPLEGLRMEFGTDFVLRNYFNLCKFSTGGIYKKIIFKRGELMAIFKTTARKMDYFMLALDRLGLLNLLDNDPIIFNCLFTPEVDGRRKEVGNEMV